MTTPNGKAPAKKALHWLQNKALYSVGFGLALLFVISLGLFFFSDFAKPKPDVVRISYSSGGPLRKHFLEEMALHGKALNLDIRLVPSENTDTTLTLIDHKAVDLGLIAGAIEDRASRKVLEVSPLYMEPLQLLVKADLYDAVSKDFGALKGKSISTDGVDTATDVLATQLLRFIGLTDPTTGAPQYQPEHISQARLASQTDDALPDAIFQIGGVPSPTIENLVAHHNYRLVALPFGGAFNLSAFLESEAPKPAAGARLGLDKSAIEEAVIPAYVYGVLPAVPAVDTRTIAARLVLVGGAHVKKDVVQRILTLVMSPDISHIVEPQLTVKLLDTEFQFQRHPGTNAYLASLQPFNVDGAFSNYQRMAEIWGILVALYFGATNAWKWWKARQDRAERLSVADFMSQLLEVEDEVHRATSDEERKLLDQRLNDIKKRSIELHLDGRLEDAENFQSLLVALADTRAQIWGAAT
jgi:TRAP-type uncharacterized transport system substrate-binding protein